MTPEQADELLAAEETETIERKTGFDPKEVRQVLIAFSNDLSGRRRAWLILGQAPNKDLAGLAMGVDEL